MFVQICRSAIAVIIVGAALLITALAAQAGPLRAGAARVDITPEANALPPTYTSIAGRMYARAIVLDNGQTRAAIISGDLPKVAPDIAEAVTAAAASMLDVSAENILLSATHNHSAIFDMVPANENTHAENRKIQEGFVEAIRQAKANLQPAKIGFGTGAAYLNVNRDAVDPDSGKWVQGANLDGPSDKTVSVLSLVKPGGEPIAVYVNYAMHPINGWVVGVVDADFPGAMAGYVEKAFGGDIVVAFSQGTSGDQNPLYLRPSTNAMASRAGIPLTGYEMNREASEGVLRMATIDKNGAQPPPADAGVLADMQRFVESEGQVLGEEVIRVMSNTTDLADDVRIEGLEQTIYCPGRKRTNGNSNDPNTREGVAATYVDGPPAMLRMGVLGIGAVALASVNREVYTLIGRRVKDAAPMKNTVIVTVAGASIAGYVYDDQSAGHDTFQVLGSPFKPGCAEAGITNAIVAMEKEYLGGHQDQDGPRGPGR